MLLFGSIVHFVKLLITDFTFSYHVMTCVHVATHALIHAVMCTVILDGN